MSNHAPKLPSAAESRRERFTRRLFIVLIVGSLLLVGWLFAPFWKPFLFATVLAGALTPLRDWLTVRLRCRPALAATTLTVAVLFLILAPLTGVFAGLLVQVIEGVRFVEEALREGGVYELIDRLPESVQELLRDVVAAIPRLEEQLAEQFLGAGAPSTAAEALRGILEAISRIAFQSVMFVIALYAFLLSGHRLVGWLASISPLRPGQLREILQEFRKTTTAVLASTVATSATQASVALVGYLIAQVPQPFFFTAATFIFAFVPAIGGSTVCILTGALLLAIGSTAAGIFLILWGVGPVGLSDNFVKPWLIKGEVALPGIVVFFALIGGLVSFGMAGLVLGPLIVVFFMTVVRIYQRDFMDEP